ncbi:hypothetical protein QE152_g8690 [Popillia japonica]|uniref:Uncharacterized protein n=1 Tax=Popillia japonica TaxID=7064 RepID=A0AAW1M1Y7_POPJA
MATTRSQRAKANKDATVSQANLNSSYITIYSKCDEEKNCKEIDLVSHLRNKLAHQEFKFNELQDENNKLQRDLNKAKDNLRSKQAVIDDLQKTLNNFANNVLTDKIVHTIETQTDNALTTDKSTHMDSGSTMKRLVPTNELDLTMVPVQNVEILEFDTPITTDTSTRMDGGDTDVGHSK